MLQKPCSIKQSLSWEIFFLKIKRGKKNIYEGLLSPIAGRALENTATFNYSHFINLELEAVSPILRVELLGPNLFAVMRPDTHLCGSTV